MSNSIINTRYKFIKNIFHGFGTNIIVLFLGVGTGIITARGLGPEGKGILTAILLGPFILTPILSLGVGNSNVYLINKYPTKCEFLFANSFWIVIAISPIIFAIQAFIPLIMHSYDNTSVVIARIYLMFTPIGIFVIYLESLLRGLKKFSYLYFLKFLYPAILMFLLVIFFINGLTLIETCISLQLAGVVVLILGILFLRKQIKFSLKWDTKLLKESLVYGIKSAVTSLSDMAQLRLDQLIMVPLILPFQLGLYSVAVKMAESLWQVSNSIGTVLLPEISGKNLNQGSMLIAKALFGTMLLLIIVGCFLFVLASPIILFFFGKDYWGSIMVFRVLIIASIIMGMTKVIAEGLYGLGLAALPMYGTLLALFVNVGFLVMLIPSYGILGASIASLIAYSSNFLFLIISFRKETRISVGFILKNGMASSKMIIMSILRQVKAITN